ncbi:MAG TPA: phenylalanine--tRNA ligase subunit beta, partial [bacterium]|nr:phenylalanine--tRNA ligase subunit beta [bacterium]
AEISIDLLPFSRGAEILAAKYFPPVIRDISLVAEERLTYEKILNKIITEAGKTLVSAILTDHYSGPQVAEGKKSLTFRLIFQSDERTLTDDEVEEKLARVLESLGEAGVVLR